MAALRERVFTDAELDQQVQVAYAQAGYMLGRNRQEQYALWETIGTALQQVLTERNALRGSHAGSAPNQEGPDPSGAEQADQSKRKRVQRQPGAG